jgi:hypothetical protein
MLLTALLMVLVGCTIGMPSGGSANPPKVADAPPEPPRTIEEVERDIDRTQKHIEDLSTYETQQRQIGVINQVEHDRTRGWVKLDGHPSYEELADQAYAQAAATEKEIQRLERQVTKLEKEKQTILSQSTGCFPPDALVTMEDGAFKPFKAIAPGDKVLTYDIGYDQVVSRPVIGRYKVDANHLYTINGELMTTGGERLLTRSGWKKVRDLKIGDVVHMDGRMVEIVSIDYQRVHRTLYNLQVEDTHNFYVVTANGARYLVHNTGGGSGGGGSGGGGSGGGGGSK